MLHHSLSVCAFLFCFWCSLACIHLFYSLHQNWSTVAQWAVMTVAKCSLVSCMQAHFLTGSLTIPGQWLSSPLQLRWVEGVCLFRCNLPHALLAKWPGSFTCHCSNTGVEQTSNKSQHRNLTGEENSPSTPTRIPTHKLLTMSLVCYQQAILAPLCQS